MSEIDLSRVLCALGEIPEDGSRAFTVGEGDWPLQGFLVRSGGGVFAYENHCPHAGHPLNLRPHDFLTPDRRLIVCCSHGAVFEKSTGLCLAGPCVGDALHRLPIEVRDGYVYLGPIPEGHGTGGA